MRTTAFATFLVWRLRTGACGVGVCGFWRYRMPPNLYSNQNTGPITCFRCYPKQSTALPIVPEKFFHLARSASLKLFGEGFAEINWLGGTIETGSCPVGHAGRGGEACADHVSQGSTFLFTWLSLRPHMWPSWTHGDLSRNAAIINLKSLGERIFSSDRANRQQTDFHNSVFSFDLWIRNQIELLVAE